MSTGVGGLLHSQTPYFSLYKEIFLRSVDFDAKTHRYLPKIQALYGLLLWRLFLRGLVAPSFAP